MGYYRGSDNRSDRDPRAERDYRARDERYGQNYAGQRYGGQSQEPDRSRPYGQDDRPRYGADRRPPSDYDADHRGFFDRAGDEVRSWFGDEEAERRRAYDDYMNRNYGDPRDQSSRLGFAPSNYRYGSGPQPFTGQPGSGQAPEVRHDPDYHAWRQDRIDELDRDYHEYRSENREKFNREFGDWRGRRNVQRGSLTNVREHQDVVGSDGGHVGKVDKVAGDRIILAKNDEAAGGRHHAIPSRWIDKVEDDKVVLEKTAAQAKQAWSDAEGKGALFGDDGASGPHYLNNAFSGTY